MSPMYVYLVLLCKLIKKNIALRNMCEFCVGRGGKNNKYLRLVWNLEQSGCLF